MIVTCTYMQIPNDEMYWVVTTVISETRSEIRAKLIKHFIKVASKCARGFPWSTYVTH